MREVYSEGCCRSLALDEEGNLWIADGEHPDEKQYQPVDFNHLYSGYYPACRFSAIGADACGFIAAGNDEQGELMIFRSMMGGVWEQQETLIGNRFTGYIHPAGRAVALLTDPKTQQHILFLDCGDIITLPDCPKCARMYRSPYGSIVDAAWAEDHQIRLSLADDSFRVIPFEDVSQVRIHYEYAREKLSRNALLIDLRANPDENADVSSWDQEWLKTSIHLLPDDLEEWLRTQDKTADMCFFCNWGVQADAAAETARRLGFHRAFSLGGIRLPV